MVATAFKNFGIPLWGITLQNEPRYEPGSYPGTKYTARNESVLARLLHPLLSPMNVKVVGYDHNWDNVSYPIEIMDLSPESIDYMAFHCYDGDVSNQTVFHNAFPNTPIIFTECSQTGNEGSPQDFLNDFMDNARTLYFGNINNWGQSVLHWSMAVDLNLGPHSGGCGTCSGVVTVDAGDLSKPYTVRYNSETYSIAHFSALIPPNANNVLTDTDNDDGVLHLGFVNPDGSRVVQLLNTNRATQQVMVYEKEINSCFTMVLAAQSLYSFVYSPSIIPHKTVD